MQSPLSTHISKDQPRPVLFWTNIPRPLRNCIQKQHQIVSVLRFQGFLIKQSHKSPLRTAPLPRHTRPSLYHQRPPCLSHAKQAVHPRPTLQERSLYHSSPVGILHTVCRSTVPNQVSQIPNNASPMMPPDTMTGTPSQDTLQA